jgi:transposase
VAIARRLVPRIICSGKAKARRRASPANFGGYKGYALAAHRQLVAEQPDVTLAELKVVLAKAKVKVGQSSISRFLRHFKLPFRKNPLKKKRA